MESKPSNGAREGSVYVNQREIAELLRVDRSTVRRWVERGEIPPPVKVGGVLRWDRQQLLAELDLRRQTRCDRTGA